MQIFLRLVPFCALFFSSAWAETFLADYTPHEYSVLFTNPLCGPYPYAQEVLSVDGEVLKQKPLNVYCKKQDREASASRASSPEYKIKEWLQDPKVKSVFFAYLSFSNKVVAQEICQQVKTRGLEVTLILDESTDRNLGDELSRCRPEVEGAARAPIIYYRGNSGVNGGGRIGLQHNKIMLYQNDSSELGVVFSSANLSTGTVLHHENWHFIRTAEDSYFGQSHLCLKEGLLNYYQDKKTFREFIALCKSKIAAAEEDDIQTFFVPGEGNTAGKVILEQLAQADEVFIAAHRFSWTLLQKELLALLTAKKIALKIVVDDDIYWSGKLGRGIGANTTDEARRLEPLVQAGAQVRYMETNQKEMLFHHNKFMVFKKKNQGLGVFAGAGNFTTTAFTDNFENFYWIQIPQVTQTFILQSEHLWQLATPVEKLPREMVLP